MSIKIKLTAFGFLIAVSMGYSAIRIADYNTCGGSRSGMSTILQYIGSVQINGIARPADILLLQEQDSTTMSLIATALNTLYGANTYAAIPLQGSSTGSGLPGAIYKISTVQYLETVVVNSTSTSGAARSTLRYKFRPVGYTSPYAIFYIYNSHYKASDTTSDSSRRGVEAAQIRTNSDALGDGIHIIYAGDLNLYSDSEPAWTKLTAAGNGQAFDPVNRAGSWSDNSSFREVHTQSPTSIEHYSGQVTGGMDDRFDFQLISNEFNDGEGLSYIPGSYRAVGNNGTHSLNGAITSGSGAPSDVLTALEYNSDHLPVMADYQVPAVLHATAGSIPAQIEINTIATVNVAVQNGALVTAPAGADELDYTLTANGAVTGTGSGTIAALGTDHLYNLALDTSTVGIKNGQIIVTTSSQGAENANVVLPISYQVIDNNSQATADFGWEDFVWSNDPQVVLGLQGNMQTKLLTTGSRTGQNSLTIQNAVDSGYCLLAVINNLQHGDNVQASIYARSIQETFSGVCLEGCYLTDGANPFSITGAPMGCSGTSLFDWTALNESFIFDSAGGLHQGLVIRAHCPAGQSAVLDDLKVIYPAHSHVSLPQPSTVTCTLKPQYDFNGDCKENMKDFSEYASNWLDGTAGSSPSGTMNTVIITGILDGTIGTGAPRAIELYVDGTHNLSEYQIQRCISGGSWETGVSLSGTYTDTFVYLIGISNDGVNTFNSVFGNQGPFANRALLNDYIYCDGNDAFRLVKNSTIIDQVYTKSTAMAYRDSFMYRNNNTGPDGTSWNTANWTIPGNDILDNFNAEQIRQSVPFGTWQVNSTCTKRPDLDYSNDCQINIDDIMFFVQDWMQCGLQPDWACTD